MNESNLGPEQFLKEKNLFQIYKASWRISFNKFNVTCAAFVFLMCVFDLLVSNVSLSDRMEMVREISAIGLSVSINLLGFLIAGFAIFSGITSPNLSLFMATKAHPESGLSYLKHNYFNFMNVFVYFMCYCGICFLVGIFGAKGGLFSSLVHFAPRSDEFGAWIVYSAYVAIVTGFAYMILLLKSFIFNIYHSVMTSLRYEYELRKRGE